jgi:hypothetical protein
LVFFFGNDVGFWRAHQQLAERLAVAGYGVVGFDVRSTLAALPDGPPAGRDSAFLARVGPLVAGARAALGGASRPPLVLGGHSIGAELALWTAAHLRPVGLVGVLALAPGARGHLRITLADIAEHGEPVEPGSFAVADEIRAVVPMARVAVVRGAHDRYGGVEAALVAAGARRFPIPFAGHALRRLLVSTPVVESALAWLVADRVGTPSTADPVNDALRDVLHAVPAWRRGGRGTIGTAAEPSASPVPRRVVRRPVMRRPYPSPPLSGSPPAVRRAATGVPRWSRGRHTARAVAARRAA